ncbi:hypothetical protein GWO43_14935 [candidate division KSB1 bacterium]|nr:hypothetical protein [candidate division KSB1 bacterium]NIR73357.1 hypothetical protein [candidate division KSB1 bacterium]NIS25237.1 hypothetical protein [candidate division KSB1 bacterium]NIT72140.1 hypothetical protein [candidate division KSB1 bacterium]NIU25946.1 hypothetical protein [candidate division KSB1 bacterium]
MKKSNLLLLTVTAALVFASQLYAFETAVVIKVTGVYGIINKGKNQGVVEGQILFVKRSSADGIIDITKVKVIRTTANRAAVEQLSNSKEALLQKGDKLFSQERIRVPVEENTRPRPSRTNRSRIESARSEPQPQKKTRIEPITDPVDTRNDVPRTQPETKYRAKRNYNLRKPWLTFNIGAILPNGQLARSYSPSFKFGGSYMISTGNDFNLGFEINKAFFSNGSVGNQANNVSSASIFEGFVVFQKFLGYNFFLETGGGIYRPKIQLVSADNIESSFSASKFGIFGGAGFFVPTSQYAGFALKGRLHNYFDTTAKQYFGLTGGFRFKVK